MNFAVLQFPGSNCDQDVVHVLQNVLGQSARLLWHKEHSLGNADAVMIPGGFSYGDYLRTGAIARFSPVMEAVRRFALEGGRVLGICNGFQILCEAGLLPGALIRNRSLQFRCEHVFLQTVTQTVPSPAEIPTGHNAANSHCSRRRLLLCGRPDCWTRLRANDQILWRYVYAARQADLSKSNPNGSFDNIAGICNEARNVAGLMPHPERASESILGCADGRLIFESLIHALEQDRLPAGQHPGELQPAH